MIEFSIIPDNKRIRVKPTVFLDRPMFEKYKSICDANAARYDGRFGGQVCVLETVPVLMQALVESGFKCDLQPALMSKIQEKAKTIKNDLKTVESRLEIFEEKLKERGLELYPFQRTGIQWLTTRHKALLADDMGLGKTLQALMSIPENTPVVVVCPASVKGNWKRECEKWRPDLNPFIFSGRGVFIWPKPGQVFIFNYDILPGEPPPDCPKGLVVISDESQKIKNSKSKRTIFFRQIKDVALNKDGRTWLLTGSPMLNYPPELWSVLEGADLAHEAFGSWSNFTHLFHGTPSNFGHDWCVKHEDGTIMDPEIPNFLKKVMLKRNKKDVLKELPDKMYSDIICEINDNKIVNQCNELLKLLEEQGYDIKTITLQELMSLPMVFENIAKIRSMIAKAKIPMMLDIVEQYEENEEPLIVFSAHRSAIDIFATREGWVTLTGDTSNEKRTQIVEDFQAGKYKGIALTIQAGGIGITLTRAAHSLFVDLMWTPELNLQAEDRNYRIGQSRGVQVIRMVSEHVLEKRIHELLTWKKEIIAASVGAAKIEHNEVVEYDFKANVIDKIMKSQEKQMEMQDINDEFNPNNIPMANIEKIVNSSDNIKVNPEEKKINPKREPQSPIETWAKNGLLVLSRNDPDKANVVNGVGFNKFDGEIGHSLAKQCGNGLSEKQWRLAIRICVKYQKQIGAPPQVG